MLRRIFRKIVYINEFSFNQLFNLVRFKWAKRGAYSQHLSYKPVDLGLFITSRGNLKRARSPLKRLNVSLDGISSEKYSVVRKVGGRTYRTIVSNIQQLVETRNKLGS